MVGETYYPTTMISSDAPVDLSPYPALLTVQDVAALLQLSVPAIRARIRARELTSIKMGHSVRVPRAELARYLAERTVPRHEPRAPA